MVRFCHISELEKWCNNQTTTVEKIGLKIVQRVVSSRQHTEVICEGRKGIL